MWNIEYIRNRIRYNIVVELYSKKNKLHNFIIVVVAAAVVVGVVVILYYIVI